MSEHGTCATCGSPADKTSSGLPECWPCWNWRKLDGPAARHWARVATEFLSNVDMYDVTKFLPACGLTEDEIGVMLATARKVRDHSKSEIQKHEGDDR